MGSSANRLPFAAAAVWAGVAVGARSVPGSAAAAALLACAAAAMCGGLVSRRPAAWWLASLALSGAGLGACSAPPGRSGRAQTQGCVVSLAQTPQGWLVDLVEDGRGEPRSVEVPRTGVRTLDSLDPALGPGIRLLPVTVARGGAGRLRVRCAGLLRAAGRCGPAQRMRAARARWRLGFLRRAARRIGEPGVRLGGSRGLLYALVTGDRSGIDRETGGALRASGLAHLAVVSGLHVGLLLVLAASALGRLAGRRHRAAALLRGSLVALLIPTLPLSPPVLRAGLLLLLVEAGVLASRRGPALGQLGAVVLLLLLADPRLAWSWSLALTVAATAAILLALRHPPRRRWLLVPVSPFLATWPLVLEMAGRASPWGVPATLVAGPALAPAIGAGWMALLLPESLARQVALPLARAAAGVIRATAFEISSWPGSGLATPRPGLAVVGLHLALLGWTLLGRRRRDLLRRGAALLALTALEVWPGPARTPGAGVLVADVGQGQAVLAAGEADSVLLDAGPALSGAAGEVVRSVFGTGLPRPGLLALSHADLDHVGGAPELLQSLRPRLVAMPGGCLAARGASAVREASLRLRIPLAVLSSGRRWSRPGLALEWLYPPPGRAGCSNHHSAAVLVRAGGVLAFVGGDLDRRGEHELLGRWPDLPRVDLLVAGHHGSRSSTGGALLAALRPKWVVFSCGPGRGHPHAEVLGRVTRLGSAVWITHRDGSVLFQREGGSLRPTRVR